MPENFEQHIQSLKADNLTPLVRQALQQPEATVSDWQATRINKGTFGIVYRFQGTASNASTVLPWSLILKIVHYTDDAPIDRSSPANVRYWKREPLVYQSGLLEKLSGDLVAPRCFSVEARATDEMWLWLEDVTIAGDTDPDTKWSLEDYARTAQHLGQFSGDFLTVNPLPTDAWFGRRLLHSEFAAAEAFIAALPTQQDHPLMQILLSGGVAEGLFRLWAARTMWLEVVDQLPQTVCHRDANPINLFHRRAANGTMQTVAIDWEDVAIGPVGEDIVSMIVLGLGHGDIALAEAKAFDDLVFKRYLAGLYDRGWVGNSDVVRLGYTASTARYAIALPQVFLPRLAKNSQTTTPDLIALAEHWSAVLQFVFARLDEADELRRRVLD